MNITQAPQKASDRGERAAQLSIRFLWWLPLSPIVGFIVANRLLSESWPLWQVLPLAIVLATPFAVGAYFGLKAVRLGERRAWAPLAIHVVFMTIALVMPISQSLS
ncbi:MAG TPA: hypothetical protein VFV13_02950 [Acidimicrobiia bacterium]|nr:hypothetical protein [Acidimicrobiia bacterium]